MPIKSFPELTAAARQLGPARIAVAAADDADVLEALREAEAMGLATGVLVGDRDKVQAAADSVGYRTAPDRLIDEPDVAAAAARCVSLVRGGAAELIMKGKLVTADLIRAVLDRDNGLRTGRHLSQVIVFSVPGFDRLMLMGDAALNIAPTLEQKASICNNMVGVAHALGIERPNVVALCAYEKVNPAMPATVDADALKQMCQRGEIPGAYVEGPLALDAPLSRFAAERKGIDSPVVGNSDVFLLPNIEAANILYRAILYFAGGESGGVVVGARAPLILLSRAETPITKIHSICLALLVNKYQSSPPRVPPGTVGS